VPLSAFRFGDTVVDGASAPTPAPPPFQSAGAPYGASAPQGDRASFPRPPSMHWFLVFLLGLMTIGIFTWVWMFVQSSWVKKIDRSSSARELFVAGVVLTIVGAFAGPAFKAPMLGGLLTIAACIVVIVGCFSVARSLREEGARRGLPVEISGITLFFFQVFYLQGQFTWLARWKDTGQTVPKAPTGVFWLLMIFPFVLGILAAIAIPAYNSYLTRVQVSEGVVLADRAKTAVAEFYTSHGQMPVNNMAAGLALPDDIHGKYTASVTVDNGTIVVIYANDANRNIHNDSLRLTPWVSGSQVNWRCGSDDIQKQYLPASCR
jgi:Tfp pilus assembly major pilin PilA